jgi:DNA-directed RNA polymerase specialized sigma24 family protein
VSSPGSVTGLIAQFKNGDSSAAQKLWDLFAARLAALARPKLARSPALGDEEDVALSALNSFFTGVEQERFPQLDCREALWRLLSTMTNRKIAFRVRQQRCEKRGGQGANRRRVYRLQENSISIADPAPPPDIRAAFEEACDQLLEALGDSQLRSVAMWKMEGYADDEIATKLGCALRTVERKTRLIRTIWHDKAMNQPGGDSAV